MQTIQPEENFVTEDEFPMKLKINLLEWSTTEGSQREWDISTSLGHIFQPKIIEMNSNIKN